MAKRYYLCDVTGTGAEDDPFRPIIEDLPNIGGTTTVYSPDMQHAMVLCAAANHAHIRAAPGVDPLPEFPLDGKVSSIQTATKNKMKSDIAKRNIPTSTIDTTDGYREVIRLVGKHWDANFHEDNFDVRDV